MACGRYDHQSIWPVVVMVTSQYGLWSLWPPVNMVCGRYDHQSIWSVVVMVTSQYGLWSLWFPVNMVCGRYDHQSIWPVVVITTSLLQTDYQATGFPLKKPLLQSIHMWLLK